ncbi:hypothetical protein ACLB2K_022986 [Fragaria x ananassa]
MGFKSLFSRNKKSTPSSPTAAAFDAATPLISPSELDEIMGSLVHLTTEDELRSMILEVYADGNRFIDINEVMELNTNGINSAETMQNLKDAFSVYDIDGNGSISAVELSTVPSHSS